MNPKLQQICTAQSSALHTSAMDLALCLPFIAICIHTISAKWCHWRVLIQGYCKTHCTFARKKSASVHLSYSLKSNSARQLEFGGLCFFNGSFWVFCWNQGKSIAMCIGESPRNLSHLCVTIFKLNDIKMLIWACRTSEFNLVSFTEKFDCSVCVCDWKCYLRGTIFYPASWNIFK